ncbi:MAG: hypothetical protein CFE23_12600 [Flavobacterium sp. BFFFF1]|uniref:hypothetical protein n=1 Tax=Flavobacterium sp. BFFFF1 TaxID=2015557 RepID=UPI000BD03900|nr:hypothetical protein [Flavobacterium sp. BFFFF1]OYU79738.1 MAG: hypothetical protein CFE23_12600 [Flavobacterium sp. BFFFF1]
MKIVDTFSIVEDSLYSVQFENEEYNEFRKLFLNWNDPEFLHRFFSEHENDLKSAIWGYISVDEAIEKTRNQAKWMEKKILDLANTPQDPERNLLKYFEPLGDTYVSSTLELNKGKGLSKHNWLRIYAVEPEPNLYVISGGGIKLTPTMNDRDHLKLELRKLKITKNYLNT